MYPMRRLPEAISRSSASRMVWLQIRLHRIEQIGRGVDVDEHAVRQYGVQGVQIVGRQRRRADGDEAVEMCGLPDQFADRRKRGQVHALPARAAFQHVAQFVEIRVLKILVGSEIAEHRDRAGQGDALCLGGIAQFLAHRDDLAPRIVLDGQRRVAVEQSGHRGLGVSRALRYFPDRDHDRLSPRYGPYGTHEHRAARRKYGHTSHSVNFFTFQCSAPSLPTSRKTY